MASAADLKRMVSEAQRVVVFTGAGISTESGIPDFRSPGGVWSRMKPIYFQDFVASEDKRREAWTRTFSGAAGWTGAKPNAGHYAVARLVGRGKVSAVITQNVDNLHQDSGVPAEQVIELHGNASYATCLECGLRHELADLKAPSSSAARSRPAAPAAASSRPRPSRSASRCRRRPWPAPRPRPGLRPLPGARLVAGGLSGRRLSGAGQARTAPRWPSSTASPPSRTPSPTSCSTTRSAR